MLETSWYESLQGRAGYIIYSYCMYTIKLKALILSIVFNYLRFLMMKIDCTEFVFFFILCLCMLPGQAKTLWMVHQYLCHTTVAVQPGVKKKKKRKSISAAVCRPSWMHKLNICNSGFALICTPDIEHILTVYYFEFFSCLLFPLESVILRNPNLKFWCIQVFTKRLFFPLKTFNLWQTCMV